MFCMYCNHKLLKKDICLCGVCYNKICFLSIKKTFISSIFLYDDITRALILEAKVKGNHKAFILLKKLLISSLTKSNLLKNCTVIIPAPSSLWSRFYGRFDVAWILSHELAKIHQKPLKTLPYLMYFKWQKNSFLKQRTSIKLKYKLNKNKNRTINHVLIFDDVITTGSTIKKMVDILPKDINIKVLTLSRSKIW